MSTSGLKSNGDTLKGLNISNVRGGKEVLQEIFRHAMNETRCFYGEEEKLYIIRGRTIVAGIGGSLGSIAGLSSTSGEGGTVCCTGVVCSNCDINQDGGRMRSRVCNEGKVGSPRGAGRIICLPGICVSSSGADARKMALEIAVKGWFTSGDDVLRGS